MSIVGLPFDQGVKTQINQRSKLMANSSERGSLLGVEPDQGLLAQNKTSWVRLASAIDIKAPTTTTSPAEQVQSIQLRVDELTSYLGTTEGSALARNFVLTQGTRSVDNTGNFLNQRVGITPNGAYGIGGDRFGYKPMPALESINVSYYNRGSLAKADIKIKVFSTDQLSYIETLFMRPGYTVLLEWGHSTYIDNSGNYVDAKTKGTPVLNSFFNPAQKPAPEPVKPKEDENKPSSSPKVVTDPSQLPWNQKTPQESSKADIDWLEGTPLAQDQPLIIAQGKPEPPNSTTVLYGKIKKERANWSYNYDGFYGKITNFNWTFNEDGSYDVTLKAITVGDVIESLRINPTIKGISQSDQATEEDGKKVDKITYRNTLEFLREDDSEELRIRKVLEQAQGNALINGLFQVMLGGTRPQKAGGGERTDATQDFNFSRVKVLDVNNKENGIYYFEDENRIKSILNLKNFQRSEILQIKNDIRGSEEAETLGKAQYYITLGCFFRYLQENFIIYTENLAPYFTIDSAYYKADGKTIATPLSTFPGHISGDPKVCIIPGDNFASVENLGEQGIKLNFNKQLGITAQIKAQLSKNVKAPFVDPNNPFIGNMMSIYVNFDVIINSILNNTEEDGTVKFIKFIKDILSKIKDALGGIHEFETRFIEEENEFSIYEQGSHILDQYNDTRRKLVTFSPYGMTSSRGSIAKNISFSSELTNEFATQISIGAQANGNQVGENATAYSTYNQGLIDRIEPLKLTTKDGKDPQQTKTGKTIETIIEKMTPLIGALYAQDVLSRKYTQESITALKNLNKDYARFLQGYWVQQEQACQPPFFIPFNLSLTLEGISGIKLFEKFVLDDSILPYTYKNKVDFLVKSLTHTVQSEKWETKLETLAVPRLVGPSGKTIVTKPTLPKTTTPINLTEVLAEQKGDLKTLILGHPFPSSIVRRKKGPAANTAPTMIFLHHTAGGIGDPKNTLDVFKARGVSANYIIGAGSYDQLVDAEQFYTYHAGHGASYPEGVPAPGGYAGAVKAAGFPTNGVLLNSKSIGIEVQGYGQLVQKNGKWYNAYKDPVPEDQTAEVYYFDGKVLPNGWRGFKRYHKHTEYQIQTLKKILLENLRKYNIPFVWNQATYDEMFPNANNWNGSLKNVKTYRKNLSFKCMSYTPGIYTHNSSRIDKADISPQKPLLDMLKELSDELNGKGVTSQSSGLAQKLWEISEKQKTSLSGTYPYRAIWDAFKQGVNNQKDYNDVANQWKVNKNFTLFEATPDASVPTLTAFLVETLGPIRTEVNNYMKDRKIAWKDF